MNKKDIEGFAMVWGPAHENYGKVPSDAMVMMAFNLLEKYSLVDIKKALASHMLDPVDGKFVPKPADIVDQIERANPDGRLSADEAWAIAIETFDENRTVYVTDSINAGLLACGNIYRDGDKIGARMAFKEAYNRQVGLEKSKGLPQKFLASLGWDVAGRETAKQEAIAMGRITGSVEQIDHKPFLSLMGKVLKKDDDQPSPEQK